MTDNRQTLKDFINTGTLGFIIGSPIFMDTEAMKVAIRAESEIKPYDGAPIQASDFEVIKDNGKTRSTPKIR